MPWSTPVRTPAGAKGGSILEVGAYQKSQFFNSLVGRKLEVLTENGNKGLTSQFVPVELSNNTGSDFESGLFLDVEVLESFEDHISGAIV